MNGEKSKVRLLLLVWLMISMGLFPSEQTQGKSDCLVIFFIDIEDFMCLTCLDSFIDLCRMFPPEILREKTFVVLTDNGDSGESPARRKKINLKKIQALFRSNGLSPSLCLDNIGLFQEIRGKADLVVFEPRYREIKSFCLPLSQLEIREVLSSIRS
jgi:hypothetical protein